MRGGVSVFIIVERIVFICKERNKEREFRLIVRMSGF